MSTILNQDPEMIERMENDLREKATDCFGVAGVNSLVYGVFSMDHLESLRANEIEQGKVGIGIQYNGAAPVEIDFNKQSSAAPGQGTSAKLLAYSFLVILAVPVGPDCLERYNATKLLTLLRQFIQGSIIAGDQGQRRWSFQRERPEIGASDEDTLYYSQVWQVALVNVGPIRN